MSIFAHDAGGVVAGYKELLNEPKLPNYFRVCLFALEICMYIVYIYIDDGFVTV